MNLIKPKFWGKKNNFISLLLFPLSFLIQILIKLKKSFYFKKTFKIPVICIGNIYVGGTGKTPLSLLIAKELLKLKKRPAIIRKYYKEHIDEYNLVKNDLDCLFLAKNRSTAIENAEKNGYQLAILDDGFQDFSIVKNLNILCFNSKQLIGNGMTMPSGPLRENLNSIKKSRIIVINGKKSDSFEKKISEISSKTEIFYSNYILKNLNDFKNKKFFAFAGIGNPENFFDLLSENKIDVMRKISFPDHYAYSKYEIKKLIDESYANNAELLTTEKDFFRIKDMGYKKIKFAKVDLVIKNKKKLIDLILNCK